MVIGKHPLALHMTCLRLLAVLLLAGSSLLLRARADEPPSDLTPAQREKLDKEASQLNEKGVQLYRVGKFPEAVKCFERALVIRQQLYPQANYPAGHPDLVTSLNNLGLLLRTQGKHEQALGYLRRALKMYEQLYPESKYPAGHLALATSLNNLGLLLQTKGEYEPAVGYHRRALQMLERLYPPAQYPAGHPDLIPSLINLNRNRQ